MVSAAKQPKHAPSAKLALDDVLKSLQDLIRNDLPEIDSAPEPGTVEAVHATPDSQHSPAPTAKDLIQELEAGLADLNAPNPTLTNVTTSVEPSVTTVVDAADKTAKTQRAPAPGSTVAVTRDRGLDVGLDSAPNSLATPSPTAPTVETRSTAIVTPPSLPQSKPANLDIDSLTGVKLDADPTNSLVSEFLREKPAASPDLLSLNSAAQPLPEPTDTADLTAQFDSPMVAGPGVTDITPLDEPAMGNPPNPLKSEFLQEQLPADSQLDALENVHLDFSDNGETFAIEQDQSLSTTRDSHPAPKDGLSWHAPAFSLPAEDLPIESTLSPLDAPAAKPTSRPVSAGVQSELPLPEPVPHPSAAAPNILPKTSSAKATSPSVAAHLGDEDNIPLLQDVIEAVDKHLSSPGTARLNPGPEQSRRMAIQVAARLNVELRRSGKKALSSDVITRLARMLQETLAQSPPNVDNKPHNKD